MKQVFVFTALCLAATTLAANHQHVGTISNLQLEDGRATLVIVNGERISISAATEDSDDLHLGVLTRLEVERVDGQWHALEVDIDADFDGLIDDDEALPDDQEEGDGEGR